MSDPMTPEAALATAIWKAEGRDQKFPLDLDPSGPTHRAATLLANLPEGFALVSVEDFLRGLRSAVRHELSWGGMSHDERVARADLIDIEARRLLGLAALTDGGPA